MQTDRNENQRQTDERTLTAETAQTCAAAPIAIGFCHRCGFPHQQQHCPRCGHRQCASCGDG